jgi:hypothetical protein
MTIRHDPDLRTLYTRLIQQIGHLGDSRLVTGVGKHLCAVKLSFNRNHFYFLKSHAQNDHESTALGRDDECHQEPGRRDHLE